ncbi:MAG: hypothetical protein ACLQEQ_07980 [Nitrososphaerales archaeon]
MPIGEPDESVPVRGDEVCFKKSRYVVYEPYRGLHLAYHAKRYVFSGRSKYQKIDIIDNDAYGRMLFLDGNVQHTAYDARIFNEALCGHVKRSGASRVVVLGGGSGQTVISLLESPWIEHITVVDIDDVVVRCCRRYIGGVEAALGDPRVDVVIGDAFEHMRNTRDRFDAAVIDFTEIPFRMRKSPAALKQLYANIRDKCDGRCSQYIGSLVGLTHGPRLRELADSVGKQLLSNVTHEEVFIPSFGAPHTFMHAGYV